VVIQRGEIWWASLPEPVDKGLLTERIGVLPARLLKQVEEGLRLVLVL
jgi:hypothetical protein